MVQTEKLKLKVGFAGIREAVAHLTSRRDPRNFSEVRIVNKAARGAAESRKDTWCLFLG
jgi:hypothetical protein